MSTVPGNPGYPNDPRQQGGAQPGGYQQPGGYPSGGFQQPGTPAGGFQQPGYGQPGGYGQQPPPAYGQQPPGYGYQQPPQYAAGYPAPYGQPVKAGRPGMVTAAAVLAFVWGGLGILFGIIGLAAGSILSTASSAVCNSNTVYDADTADACNTVSGVGGFLIAVTIGTIVIAALMIAGGVTAISGKNGQILVIACAVYAILAIVSIIISGFGFTFLLGFVIPVLIVVFLLNGQSRAWFRSVGGRTF